MLGVPSTTQQFKEMALESQHPRPSSVLDTGPPPPDLTRYITKIEDQYLAGGGFGDVYRCQYIGGQEPQEVAVKALRFKSTVDGDADDKSIKMLRRELGIWKRLSHNNIVPFLGIAYGFGMTGAMSLVSSWMPNETLHRFLAKNDDKLEVVHRLQILSDIAKGLQYLHSFPIIHGDLNSNNVLLDADYTARLADFGYASLVGSIPEALAYLERSTARPGALRWTAPEQVIPEGAPGRTTKSDVYSFGCIALQVLSGKQPWSEVREDMAIVLQLYLGNSPGRPGGFRMIDDSHWDFVQSCWLPLQGRPTADTLLSTIQQFLIDYPPSGPLRDLFIPSSGQSQNPLVNNLPTSLSKTPAVGGLRRNGTSIKKDKDDRKRVDSSYPQSERSLTPPSHLSPPSRVTRNGLGSMRWIMAIYGATFQLNSDDIAVFVVGPHGSGKSTFVHAVTKARGLIDGGQNVRPSTGKIQAIRCELTEEARGCLKAKEQRNIVFVDTPSFLIHPRAEEEMNAWLRKSKFMSTLFGTIYTHRAEVDPSMDNEYRVQRQLNTFASAFPLFVKRAFPQRLHCVFSCADADKDKDKIADNLLKFQEQLDELRPMIKPRWKASTHPDLFIKGDPDTAWGAVEALFSPLH